MVELVSIPEPRSWRTEDIVVGTEKTRIEVVDCYVDLGQCQTPRKAVKIERRTDFLNLFSSRMASSDNLPPKLFMKGDILTSGGHFFICYQNFENTLMSYLSQERGDSEMRQIIRDLFESLQYLHRKNVTHGHIHHLNMFVLEGRGYLGGGVGKRVEKFAHDEWNSEIEVESDFMHDIHCFIINIEKCFVVNKRDVNIELYHFVNFLRKNLTLECLSHPFLLSPRLKKEYCLNVVKLLDSLNPYVSHPSQFNNVTLDKDIRQNFAMVRALYPSPESTSWVTIVEAKGGIDKYVLGSEFADSNRKYRKDDVREFIKFARNCWCHAVIDPGISLDANDEDIESRLRKLWPNCLIIVYDALYRMRSSIGDTLV